MSGATPVQLPDELASLLGESPLRELSLDDQVRRVVAIHLYVTHQVSLSAAAELTGLRYREFWDLLQSLDLPVFVYGKEEVEEDREAWIEYERRHSPASS